MNNGDDAKRFPSLDEFHGWYNLGYERPDGIPVLHSQKWVPEFEHSEFFQLYLKDHKWFERLVPTANQDNFDPLADPAFFVRSSADDRTLDVDVNCDHLTIEIIDRIQQEFLRRYPLWRVVLNMELSSCCIVIYPKAIRFGNFPLGVDSRDALRELIAQAATQREQRMRPERAQLSFLKQRLPRAVKAIGDRPFLVVGVLQDEFERHDRLIILVLVRGADITAIDLERPEGIDNDSLWIGGSWGVSVQGAVISCSDIPESACFCVACWLLPKDFRGSLTITERATGLHRTFELNDETIEHFSDASNKGRES